MQLMNDRKPLQTVGNRGTWLVRRFRVAAEGIADDEVAPADEPDVAEASPDQSEQTDKAAEGEGETLRPRKRRRIKLVRAIAAGILAAVLATAGYEGWLLFEQHQKDVAAAQALDAAKKYILALTSVDTNAIDKNFAEVLDGSTGEFKDMYTKSSAQLRQTLIDNKGAAHGNVVDAAVRSATEDKVEVVLFVDQSVSNGAAPAPQLDRSRVKITMEKVDGRWLASKVELP